MRRGGILFGLGLVVLLAVAAFLLLPRRGGPISAPLVAARPVSAPKILAKPPAAPAPSFDIVTVAPDGSAVIAGRAAPGSLVQVFDGSQKLGEVTADRRGEWVLVPGRPLAGGERRLTLRAAIGQGPIVAAAETVAVAVPRAAPAPMARTAAPPAGSTYVVQRGNSLWLIARHVFGAGIRYLTIYSANLHQIHNPDLIYPGQVFKLPKS